ncbi:MAG: ribbon-helix-helix domain-containing protein [Xanthobacteraceae bacterium]
MPTRQSSAPKAGEDAITVRLSRDLLKRIDRWIASQHSPLSRPEAIRQLAEFGLDGAAKASKAGQSGRGAEQAAGMASDMIDSLGDQSATHDDREHRKRRLLKGPSEFREMRKSTGNARRKR